jgi:hypothetical protein
MKKTQYQIDAEKFLTDTNTKLEVYFTGTRPHFTDEKVERDVYSVTLTRGNKSYTFDFGDTIANTEKHRIGQIGTWSKPNAYDILACLTTYEPEDNIDDFMAMYGYEKASVALKVYEAVKAEYKGLTSLYNDDEMALLAEIN